MSKLTDNSIAAYNRKRDFSRSPEPKAKVKGAARAAKGAKPRPGVFCVQKHLASHLHYDFRLEHNGVLLSWAVPKGPSVYPADKRLAMRVEDHPLDYAKFEGIIPSGYGAGIVMLWDTGTWTPLSDDIEADLKRGELKFELQGVKLKGSWVMVRTHGYNNRSWLLIKHRDRWAGPIDVLKAAPLSVKSKRDFVQILAADNPDIWVSERPAQNGDAGAMFADIIEKAALLKGKKPIKVEPSKPLSLRGTNRLPTVGVPAPAAARTRKKAAARAARKPSRRKPASAKRKPAKRGRSK